MYPFKFLGPDCRTATGQTSFLQNAYFLKNVLVESSLIAVAHIGLNSKNLVENHMCLINYKSDKDINKTHLHRSTLHNSTHFQATTAWKDF